MNPGSCSHIGCQVRPNKISRETTPEDFVPELIIDGKICATDVHAKLADELEALAPFGTGNPEPQFILSNMEVLSARVVGADHLQMRLRPSNPHKAKRTEPLEAIFFNTRSSMPGSATNVDAEKPPFSHLDRIACHVRWNRWNDQKKIQLVIRDLRGVH